MYSEAVSHLDSIPPSRDMQYGDSFAVSLNTLFVNPESATPPLAPGATNASQELPTVAKTTAAIVAHDAWKNVHEDRDKKKIVETVNALLCGWQ